MKFIRIAFAFLLVFVCTDAAARFNPLATVIPFDTSNTHYAWRLKGNEPATLTEIQVQQADSIIDICIAENKTTKETASTIGRFIGNHTFMRQIVPSVNAKGEIIIWANCFAEQHAELVDDWHYEPLIIHDGGMGGAFFNVMINLTTRTYYNLYVNGI
jgi:hypothetical protein